jgi:glutamate racemase
MIGVFDSGLGGLTVLRALVARFPTQPFLYLGDHASAPYGDRASAEIVELTRAGVARLFALGARLVVLGCNTATAVALRSLQRDWLPRSEFSGRCNVIGIVAPTVEAATQTPWAVTAPQYPQKNNRDVIAVFGTTRTIESGVYAEEIRKRCPRVRVVPNTAITSRLFFCGYCGFVTAHGVCVAASTVGATMPSTFRPENSERGSQSR